MAFSIGSNFLLSTGNPEPMLKYLADAGFSRIFWGHNWNTDLHYGRYELAAIRKMLRDFHFQLQDIHGSCNGDQNWFAVEEYRRKAGVELVLNRLRMLKQLGADGVLVMHQPRIKADSTPEVKLELHRQFDSIRRSLDEVVPLLEKFNAMIALENLPGDTWEFLKQLLDGYPADRIGLCFDSGHANMKLRKQLADVNAYKHRIMAVHLHDNDGTGDQHQPPFMGTINWNRVVGLLKSSAYRRPLNFELLMRNTPFFNAELPPREQTPENIRTFLADARERCEKVVALCGQ